MCWHGEPWPQRPRRPARKRKPRRKCPGGSEASFLPCLPELHRWGHRFIEAGLDGREKMRLTSFCFFPPSLLHLKASILGADAGRAVEEGAILHHWQEVAGGRLGCDVPSSFRTSPSPTFNLQKFFMLLICFCSFFSPSSSKESFVSKKKKLKIAV